jgi:nucleoside-diphosphate-sugar epimerase
LRRIVLVSSFAVYSNRQSSQLLDETCPLEPHPERRDAYCYAKVRQEEIVREYAEKHGFGAVFLRPGSIYGPGQKGMTGRVGLGTFGLFLHLGGSNRIPFTYVDNCAAAIALAGVANGIDGEAFNVVDDDLPSSRQFLRAYKKQVGRFKTLYVPRSMSYLLCWMWGKYSKWSMGQLPPAFTLDTWYTQWRKTRYSNSKLKKQVGWSPETRTQDGLRQYFSSRRQEEQNA